MITGEKVVSSGGREMEMNEWKGRRKKKKAGKQNKKKNKIKKMRENVK